MNKKITKDKLLHVIFFLVLFFFNVEAVKAQNLFPIQSNVQLIPPYSTYLTDYAQPGSEKFRVILLQKDLSQASYQLRLRFSIILDGKTIMITSRSYNPPPLTLAPGIPTVISGADLADYLDSRYLDFVGYDRNLYERTKSLPEGSFQICVTAYDYHRQNVQVSNVGCSFYYLAKNEPPLINQPACGSRIMKRDPQQIVFTWLPRNTSSPNSAGSTEYIFQLFENRIPGKNPNDIALSQPPIFTTTSDLPQIIYGPAEPQLLENMQYVWRVQAVDKGGKDDFRNNGYSEVCTFTYGGENVQDIGLVKEFNSEGVNERVGRMHWKIEPDIFDSYKITYKKTSSVDGQWGIAESSTSEATVNTLEPGTEYETRIQGKKNGFYGNYSSIITFKTPAVRVVNCNAPTEGFPDADFTKPLLDALPNQTVKINDMEMMLMDVKNMGNGHYTGKGKIYIDFLGGAPFATTYENVFIDQNKVISGVIKFVTTGPDYVKNTNDPYSHVNTKKQEANRAKYKDVAFYDQIFTYDYIIKDVTVDANGNVTIIQQQAGGGISHVDNSIKAVREANPDKAIIIQDKTGDQYVIKKDGKVEKVDGGGLAGVSISGINDDIANIIKEALAQIKTEAKQGSSLDALLTEIKASTISKDDAQMQDQLDTQYSTNTSEVIAKGKLTNDNSVAQQSGAIAGKEADYILNKILISVAGIYNTKEKYKILAASIKNEDNKTLADELAASSKTKAEMVILAKERIKYAVMLIAIKQRGSIK